MFRMLKLNLTKSNEKKSSEMIRNYYDQYSDYYSNSSGSSVQDKNPPQQVSRYY